MGGLSAASDDGRPVIDTTDHAGRVTTRRGNGTLPPAHRAGQPDGDQQATGISKRGAGLDIDDGPRPPAPWANAIAWADVDTAYEHTLHI